MAFMSIEVTGWENWVVLDGPSGGEIIPCYVCGELPDYYKVIAGRPEGADPDEYYTQEAFKRVSDYTENTECWEITQETGYGGRLSASGYMDCTEWCFYNSSEEARQDLCELYELCPVCEDSATSEPGPDCKGHHYV